jgi:hypothetical protein
VWAAWRALACMGDPVLAAVTAVSATISSSAATLPAAERPRPTPTRRDRRPREVHGGSEVMTTTTSRAQANLPRHRLDRLLEVGTEEAGRCGHCHRDRDRSPSTSRSSTRPRPTMSMPSSGSNTPWRWPHSRLQHDVVNSGEVPTARATLTVFARLHKCYSLFSVARGAGWTWGRTVRARAGVPPRPGD